MFDRADVTRRLSVVSTDYSTAAIANYVQSNDVRIRRWLETIQRRVCSEHLLIQLLTASIYLGDHDDYLEVEWHCRDKLVSLGNAFRLTSRGHYGNLHNGEFLEGQDELIALSAKPIDPATPWRDLTPVVYRWHEQTNVNWELGNGTPLGVSIIEINLVALWWQYLKAKQHLCDEMPNLPVYIQRYPINGMLNSYMNMAFFNHHRAAIMNTPVTEEQRAAAFPRPPLAKLAHRAARERTRLLRTRKLTPEELVGNIPLPFNGIAEPTNALELVLFVESGETTQEVWYKLIIEWQLALYCFQFDRTVMSKHYSAVYRSLTYFDTDKILEKMPARLRDYYQKMLIEPLLAIVSP